MKLLVGVVFLFIGAFALYGYIHLQSSRVPAEKMIRGVVEEFDIRESEVDGNYILRIQDDFDVETVVHIPAEYAQICEASDSIVPLEMIDEGVTIEVKGRVGKGGVVTPCIDPQHFVRVVGT